MRNIENLGQTKLTVANFPLELIWFGLGLGSGLVLALFPQLRLCNDNNGLLLEMASAVNENENCLGASHFKVYTPFGHLVNTATSLIRPPC